MRAESILARDIDVSSDDRFQRVSHAGVREKIRGDIRSQIYKQIHIAVDTAVVARNRSEYRDVNNAPLSKFCFVSAEPVEDAGEKRHARKVWMQRYSYNERRI
jgi:hypothetical protein